MFLFDTKKKHMKKEGEEKKALASWHMRAIY